jgi:hypothetical protein
MKRSPSKMWLSRIAGIGLALLLPGQALAHCGVLLPDRHTRAHHHSVAAPADDRQDDPSARVSLANADDGCTTGEGVFVAPRSPEKVLQASLTLSRADLSPVLLPSFVGSPFPADGRLNVRRAHPRPIPLRI